MTVYMESTESLTPTRTFELNSIYLLHAALYRNYTEVGGVRVGVRVMVRVRVGVRVRIRVRVRVRVRVIGLDPNPNPNPMAVWRATLLPMGKVLSICSKYAEYLSLSSLPLSEIT